MADTALTDTDEARVQKIERVLNTLQTLAKSMVSVAQLKQIITLRQQEVSALTKRIETLESQIKVLQEE